VSRANWSCTALPSNPQTAGHFLAISHRSKFVTCCRDIGHRGQLFRTSPPQEIRGVKGELLPASIDLSMVIEDAPMDVEVDREGFERAFPRLTVNARDAIPHGDRLLIQVKQAFPGHE